MAPLLEVKNLVIEFPSRIGPLKAVNDISFSLEKGERLGIVGESGAGKSVTGFSILNLLATPGYIASGSIIFEKQDLTKLTQKELRPIRGNDISMIFQDPIVTLNPLLTIGTQMIETVRAHRKISYEEARELAIDTLDKVYIPSPSERLNQYPHEFSGGMRQRIIIAIALITSPKLIIADEPTTALDVTIQAEIMSLLLHLCEKEDMGLILITHDLGVVSQITQRIAVMYAGTIIEIGSTEKIISAPLHPYTQGLLAALPENVNSETKRLNQIIGVMPSLMEIPKACPFHDRCIVRELICEEETPVLREINGVRVACHIA
ncbi:MAG: ABC transporter ATP-binding protein [Desulfovibrionaceae bacterium]